MLVAFQLGGSSQCHKGIATCFHVFLVSGMVISFQVFDEVKSHPGGFCKILLLVKLL